MKHAVYDEIIAKKGFSSSQYPASSRTFTMYQWCCVEYQGVLQPCRQSLADELCSLLAILTRHTKCYMFSLCSSAGASRRWHSGERRGLELCAEASWRISPGMAAEQWQQRFQHQILRGWFSILLNYKWRFSKISLACNPHSRLALRQSAPDKISLNTITSFLTKRVNWKKLDLAQYAWFVVLLPALLSMSLNYCCLLLHIAIKVQCSVPNHVGCNMTEDFRAGTEAYFLRVSYCALDRIIFSAPIVRLLQAHQGYQYNASLVLTSLIIIIGRYSMTCPCNIPEQKQNLKTKHMYTLTAAYCLSMKSLKTFSLSTGRTLQLENGQREKVTMLLHPQKRSQRQELIQISLNQLLRV